MASDQWTSLIGRMRGGDQEATAEFATWFAPRIHSYLIKRRANDAENLGLTALSDLTMAVLKPGFVYLSEGQLLEFAYTIVRRIWADDLRVNGRQSAGPPPQEPAWPDRDKEDGELSAAVFAWVGQLPEKDRVVLLQHIVNGLNFADVGAEVGLSENAARLRHHRALQRLRQWVPDAVAIQVWIERIGLRSCEEVTSSTQ